MTRVTFRVKTEPGSSYNHIVLNNGTPFEMTSIPRQGDFVHFEDTSRPCVYCGTVTAIDWQPCSNKATVFVDGYGQ